MYQSELEGQKRRVYVVGGGTVSHVRNHLALSAPAYGRTAKALSAICSVRPDNTMAVICHVTRMADPTSPYETTEDLRQLARTIASDRRTKIVFWNPAIVDFTGQIGTVAADKHAARLSSATSHELTLQPTPKILDLFRKVPNKEGIVRKDIFLVAFKTTTGASEEEQYRAGLNLLKESSANLVLANDVVTRVNMIIVPEEAAYHVTTDRREALKMLVDMAYLRSHLTFTRSTVVDGEPIAWDSSLVPASLRTIVDHCIARGAYKRFRGVTAGHFAVKLDDQTFLTSRRKTDFNDIARVGLVKVKTDGPDAVIAYGSRPSVGGQSQRILFADHPDYDCVVHFHCPIREGSEVPTVSQREFECGSHQCGENTSRGLRQFGNFAAVYLDQHGPNLVFNHSIDPQIIIDFIEANFDLTQKTGGYQLQSAMTS